MRRIILSNTLNDAFTGVLAPWFDSHGREAWRNPRPCLVVAPDFATLSHLKLLLHDAGIPTFAVDMLPITQLLARLAPNSARGILPDPALLELVTGLIAGKIADETKDEVAGAVSRGPKMLTDTLRALHQGGWSAKHINGETLCRIGCEVENALTQVGLQTDAQAAHELALSEVTEPDYGAVLAVGFDGRHWPHWPVLLTLMKRAEHFTAIFAPARTAAEEADLCWLASWEAATGCSIESVDDSVSVAADTIEMAHEANVSGVECFVSGGQKEEAAHAVRCATEALEAGARHVAIIAPPNSVIAREVSMLLSRVEWPHFDGLPSMRAGISRPEVLSALLRVQQEPHVANLAHFLRLRPYIPEAVGVRGDVAASALDRLAPNLIFPELAIALEYIRSNGDKRALPLVEQWPIWPQEDTLGSYLDFLVQLTKWLEWTPIQHLAEDLRHRLASASLLRVTRDGACKFMQEAMLEPVSFRPASGNNPYARVLLLPPSAALMRRWDAIVVTGQNDNIWPPRVEPGGYLSDEDLRGLNNRIRLLNNSAREESASGDGTLPVRIGHGYIVGPLEYRGIQVRDFIRLVAASAKTYVLCALRDESQGDRTLYPGELFSRSFAASRAAIANQRVVEDEAVKAAGLLPLALTVTPSRKMDVKQVLVAWRARRQADAKEFSEYEFCMNARPRWNLVIPPSAWGRVFDRPAEVFFRYFLGVTPREEAREELATPMVVGNWIHGWLEGSAPTGAAAQGHEWVTRVREQAEGLRKRIEAALAKQNRVVPTWWDSIYDAAISRAQRFGEALARGGKHPYVVSEAVLPETKIKLASGRTLSVLGRMDLVFTDSPVVAAPAQLRFSGRPWLFDFKTGKDEVLTLDNIAKGSGIQLGLYSMGMEARGAERVDITLQRDDCEATPQVNSGDVRLLMMPWLERCADIIDTGRLGYFGPIHSDFGGSTYPISTLQSNVSEKGLKERFATLHSL
jgi:hypothetical protein